MKRIAKRIARTLGRGLNGGLSALDLQLVRASDGGSLRRDVAGDPALVPVRVTGRDVEMALVAARSRFADRRVVLLVDHRTGAALTPVVDRVVTEGGMIVECAPRTDPASVLPDIETHIFVYACDADAVGLPFVRHITDAQGFYVAAPAFQPATFAHVNETARCVLAEQYARQREDGYDKFDLGPGDFLNIMQMIDVTRDLPGAYVEIGCFRGSSGALALGYMRETGVARDCHFLDVFTGFDYDEAQSSADTLWAGTHDTEGPEIIGRRLRDVAGQGGDLSVSVHRNNVITDDLPDTVEDIALANIDVDIYEAVLAALIRVAPRIVAGGVMIAEDAGHTPSCIGARLALEEFAEHPASTGFTRVYMESGQTIYVRTGAE